MLFTNTTPHELVVYAPDGDRILLTIPPASAESPVRLVPGTQAPRPDIYGIIPVVQHVPFRSCSDPEELLCHTNTVVIVSMVVADYLTAHGWVSPLYVPDPGPGPMGAVRRDGKIIGVRRFVAYE